MVACSKSRLCQGLDLWHLSVVVNLIYSYGDEQRACGTCSERLMGSYGGCADMGNMGDLYGRPPFDWLGEPSMPLVGHFLKPRGEHDSRSGVGGG